MGLSFPNYFPEGCPPVEATDDEKMLFRLCEGNPPSEKDFISFYEQNPERYKDRIQAYGLSVFPSVSDCTSAMNKSPKLRQKYKYIANGLTNAQRGKTLQTPNKHNPNHITWWIYEGVHPHLFFTIGGKAVE